MARNKSGLLQSAAMGFTVIAASLAAHAAFGATYNQDTDTSGSWHVAGSWTGGIPNGNGAVAFLGQPITTGVSSGGNYTISLGGVATTVGTLTSDNAATEAQGFRTIIASGGGAGRLIFNSGNASPAELNEELGQPATSMGFIEWRMRITAPVELQTDLDVNTHHALNKNTNTEIASPLIGLAGVTLTKKGLGNLQLDRGNVQGAGEFFGDVQVEEGGFRLITLTNGSEGQTQISLGNASGVTVHDGAQIQFGNLVNSVSLGTSDPDGPGGADSVPAELKLNGPGKPAYAPEGFPELTTHDGALRFDGTADQTVICSFNNPVNLVTNSHVNVASPDGTGIFTAQVLGGGQLQKTGSGLLRLNVANVYTGGTRISNGTLDVRNTSGSGVGTGNVTVDGTGATTSARLGGTGVIGAPGDPSNVTLETGDLFPGTLTAIREILDPNGDGLTPGPGLLTIHGNLTFDSASTLNMDLTGATAGSQYDQVAASGAITLSDATLNLSLGAFSPTGSEVFTLISNTGAGAVSGEFAGLAQADPITLGSQTFYIDYEGGDGNDVVLSTTIPVDEDADFDNDGDKDGNDFLIWQRGQGGAGGTLNEDGNADGDGDVDGVDLAIWEDQFGTATANVAGVPEPTTAMLMLAAAVGAAAFRRRWRAA